MLEPGAFEYRGTPSFSLEFMLKTAQHLGPILLSMEWRYAVAPIGRRFVTSDNPVFWQDPSGRPPFANGFASPGTILTFPLGPEVALVGRWRAEGPIYAHVASPFVEFVNQRVVRTADSCVFASRQEDANEAIELRRRMLERHESVGPRRSDVRILEDMSTD